MLKANQLTQTEKDNLLLWSKSKKNRLKLSEKDRNSFKNRLKKYGITTEEYNALLEKQKNLCAICLIPELSLDKRSKKFKNLAVDHDHKTGKVRGLLCSKCNAAIGLLRENPSIILNAIKYLEEN